MHFKIVNIYCFEQITKNKKICEELLAKVITFYNKFYY